MFPSYASSFNIYVAFSEHIYGVRNSLLLWHLVWLLGLLASRRYFRNSSSTHTSGLKRRKEQTKQLVNTHFDRFVPCKTMIYCMQEFSLVFHCAFELLCASLVQKMFPILLHFSSTTHEHIHNSVYDRTLRQHNKVEYNVLPSPIGILSIRRVPKLCKHQNSL